MRKIRNIKYSYMAGSRQHLTCSFIRACLRCLPLVDTDVLPLLYVPAAVVIMVFLLYILRLVVVLLLVLPLCTKKLKKHIRRENESK